MNIFTVFNKQSHHFRGSTIQLFILTLLCIWCLVAFSFAQISWTKDAKNPVMSGTNEIDGWQNHVWLPAVLYNKDSSRYEMWYGGAYGPSNNWYPRPVGYATSSDGISWQKNNEPVFETTHDDWDSFAADAPAVIRENGTYKMWYTGYNAIDDPGGIGYATSEDGITWTKDTTNNPIIIPSQTWEAGGCGAVTVMPVDSGYKMWYTGYNADYSLTNIGYAFSSDGINWVKDTTHNPVLRNGASQRWDDLFVTEPRVLIIDDVYYMFFSGCRYEGYNVWRETGLATSLDGIHWHKYNDPGNTVTWSIDSDPVIRPTASAWDGSYVQAGTVIREGDSLRMWYGGSREPTPTNKWHIGHAVSQIDRTPPLAAYSRIPEVDTVSEGETVSFKDESNGIVTSWHWDFDDGNSSDERNPQHTFTVAGEYKVMLTINGPYGSDSFSNAILVGIEEKNDIVSQYSLKQNYPNPFNPKTMISYQLAMNSEVELSIYNLLGQKVTTLVNKKQTAGSYSIEWDASGVTSGIYIYTLETSTGYKQSRKLLLLK